MLLVRLLDTYFHIQNSIPPCVTCTGGQAVLAGIQLIDCWNSLDHTSFVHCLVQAACTQDFSSRAALSGLSPWATADNSIHHSSHQIVSSKKCRKQVQHSLPACGARAQLISVFYIQYAKDTRGYPSAPVPRSLWVVMVACTAL